MTNSKLKKKSKLTYISIKIKTLKWNLTINILRMIDDRWTQGVAIQVPRDRKKIELDRLKDARMKLRNTSVICVQG